jgi:hypothetical protein
MENVTTGVNAWTKANCQKPTAKSEAPLELLPPTAKFLRNFLILNSQFFYVAIQING